MARPIWTGLLTFGLLNIPIQLMPGERRSDISFRMLDSRTKAPVRYERVNAETGEEVPWKDVVKAYEYDKGSYVVLEPSDIAAAASENRETIALEAFVDPSAISPAYLEKPYLLVPARKAEKGYVLLREALKDTRRVGIGRVVIRTREYLSMVVPQGDALMLILMRFPEELVDPAEYKIPEGGADKWKIAPKELEMAKTLLESMAQDWQPDDYRDEFRERLGAVIRKRIKTKGATTRIEEEEEAEPVATATNVVDFMALLQQSLRNKGEAGGGGGKDDGGGKAAKKTARAPAGKAKAAKPGKAGKQA